VAEDQHRRCPGRTGRSARGPDRRIYRKSGHGDYGRANDIAIAWPPGAAPLVIAIMSDRDGYTADAEYAIIAEAAAYAATTLMS
jgi:beta-lactamase class A